MKLKTLAGIVALSALAGCGSDRTPDSAAQYTQPQRPVEQTAETRRTIDATIVKTQPGIVSFCYDRGGGEHQFVWVGCETGGKQYVLIYPMTKLIFDGKARITYMPIAGGLTTREFLDRFVGKYDSWDGGHQVVGPDVFLEADGIILKDGITRGE